MPKWTGKTPQALRWYVKWILYANIYTVTGEDPKLSFFWKVIGMNIDNGFLNKTSGEKIKFFGPTPNLLIQNFWI